MSMYRDASSLVASLNSIGINQIELIHAITPEDLPCKQESLHHVHKSFGRQLSCREVAVSISHQIVREKIVSDNFEWALVLEDDAILINNSPSLKIFKSLTKYTFLPTILSLFAEQYGVFYPSEEKFIYNTIKKPDYALAYLINLRACIFMLENSKGVHLSPADWPCFIPNKMFKAISPSIFLHPIELSKSIVEEDRIIALTKKMTFKTIFCQKFIRIIFEIFSLFGRKIGVSQINSPKLRSVIIRGVKN